NKLKRGHWGLDMVSRKDCCGSAYQKSKRPLTVEAGRASGSKNRKRIVRYHTSREYEAKNIMVKLIAELDQGTYVNPSKVTVSEKIDTFRPNIP
ncbi:MAG: hypothetical protein XD97_0106, partial [Pelotomaculum thermopropionicum]